jgi:MFS family permease
MKGYPAYEWFITPMWMRRFGPLKLISCSLLDRVGLHYFTLYSTLNAVMGGAFTLAAFVLTKSFNAGPLTLGVFSEMSVVALLIGIIGAELVEGRDKRPFVLWLGLASRGAFLLFLFCDSEWSFMAISGAFFLINALLMPAVLAMWQANISTEARNKLWGLTVTIATTVSMAAAYGAGRLLDWQPANFRWVFAGAGALAMLGIVVLTLSPLRGTYKLRREPTPLTLSRLFVQPLRGFLALLARDRRFASFEAAFMVYGLALMLTFPVAPLYMDRVAGLSYVQAGIAGGVLGQVCVIFLAPLWGMLMDRRGPLFLCMVVFAILVLFPLILLAGLACSGEHPLIHWPQGPLYAVYVGYLFLGVGMSGINVAWSLGPVHFAGSSDSSGYSGAHVTLTGVRGAIGPLAGALVLNYLGFAPVFIASAALFATASVGMYLLRQRERRTDPVPAASAYDQ